MEGWVSYRMRLVVGAQYSADGEREACRITVDPGQRCQRGGGGENISAYSFELAAG